LGLDFGLGLWRLHTMAVQVERLWEFMAKGLDFGGLEVWPLEASHYAWPKTPLTIFYWLFSMDSQQSLATQSHGLLTWTAIV
jgi:hypothetical protein